MTSIKGVYFCAYPSLFSPDGFQSDEVEAADTLMRAVRGLSILRSAGVPNLDDRLSLILSEPSRDLAFEWFARYAAQEIPYLEPTVLIPIPPADCTSPGAAKESPAYRLAQAVGVERGLKTAPILYWEEPVRRWMNRVSHRLGILRVDGLPENASKAVLVGDVYDRVSTQACEALLRWGAGMQIDLALFLGRKVERPIGDIFERRVIRMKRLELGSD